MLRLDWVLWMGSGLAVAVLVGCASGDSGEPSGRDGGEAGMDATVADAAGGDAAPEDAGTDAGPPTTSGTCGACETHDDCESGSYCVSLTEGGKACVPGCVPDIPSCPRAFSCVRELTSGVDTTVCLPIGGPCCVDEDADGYGEGVGCEGVDCNDDDENVNPGADEICDGADQDCDGTPDDPPTDCVSGRCTDDGDGTYTAIEGADCVDAMCASGTTTDCGQFTCEDGGELGNACAATCTVADADDDGLCIDAAHCDDGVCVADQPNGEMCDEDGDCASDHCDNGFCCDTGTCCRATSDCPGGGAVTTICENNETCQGTRGETECTAEFRCVSETGIADDSACTSSTRARTCAPYAPTYCTGATDQPPTASDCPTSCGTDSDCIEAAHCEGSFCLPDRGPGLTCSRSADCMAGLFCADGVCCTSSCTGTCQSCNLAGSAGTCTNIPSGADPSGECPGFSCSGYYTGFASGDDRCYNRQNVSDAAGVCNGAGACTDMATLCTSQPPGTVQIDCNNTCQTPTSGTCTGTTPGSCTDLDAPGDTTSCGSGECRRTVQRCTGGLPTTCTPGDPDPETCNGLDDDCDGTIDDGSSSSLCPPPMSGVSTSCIGGGCRLDSCPAGTHDVNGSYSDGCECTDDGAGNTCGAALSLGNLGVGASTSYNGKLIPGQVDWFAMSFTNSGRPGGGSPTITITHSGGGSNPFRLQVIPACGMTAYACGDEGGAAGAVTAYDFIDDASSGTNAFSGSHSATWPSSVLVRVSRTSSATTCGEASYTLNVSR